MNFQIFFIVFCIFLTSVEAGLADLGNLKLSENELLSKTRFVFSDGTGAE